MCYRYGEAVLHVQRMHTQFIRKSMNLDELAIQMVSLGANQLFLLSNNENLRSEAFLEYSLRIKKNVGTNKMMTSRGHASANFFKANGNRKKYH